MNKGPISKAKKMEEKKKEAGENNQTTKKRPSKELPILSPKIMRGRRKSTDSLKERRKKLPTLIFLTLSKVIGLGSLKLVYTAQ